MDDIAKMLVHGLDFFMMNGTMLILTKSALTNLPHPPAATTAPLSGAVHASALDGVDRISFLPRVILRDIVSRLPVKDAVRTTVLSTRWCCVWHMTLLVLIDAHLLPSASIGTGCSRLGADPHDLFGASRSLGDTVSTVLAVYPGPFRCVYLTGTPMEMHPDELALWLQHRAAKGIQELIFLSRTTKLNSIVHLPATLFRCTSLTKLYIDFWLFPATTALPPTVAFPYLWELGLFSLIMTEQDLAFVLNRCPILEKLPMTRSRWPVCLHIRSHSLRLVEVCQCIAPEITVVDAPRLERLLLWAAWGGGGLTNMSSKIKIGHAPKLHFLGFLVPGMHQLDIGNTIIKSENDDFKFWGPQVAGTGKLNLKFWKEAGAIECVQRHIKKVVLREFQGTRSELDFLKFIAEHAQVLEKMVIVLTHGHSPSDPVATNLRTRMASAKCANACCELMIF